MWGGPLIPERALALAQLTRPTSVTTSLYAGRSPPIPVSRGPGPGRTGPFPTVAVPRALSASTPRGGTDLTPRQDLVIDARGYRPERGSGAWECIDGRR